MRALIFALLLPLSAAPALAQNSRLPGPGTDVGRAALHPGETVSFTLSAGKSEQLLQHVAPNTPHSITIRYQSNGGQSVITATSHTGYDTSFTVLADPNGSGAYQPAGQVPLPGNGSTVTKRFARNLGTINVGDFVGGPTGNDPHPAAGQ